jgi:hypothetical protein
MALRALQRVTSLGDTGLKSLSLYAYAFDRAALWVNSTGNSTARQSGIAWALQAILLPTRPPTEPFPDDRTPTPPDPAGRAPLRKCPSEPALPCAARALRGIAAGRTPMTPGSGHGGPTPTTAPAPPAARARRRGRPRRPQARSSEAIPFECGTGPGAATAALSPPTDGFCGPRAGFRVRSARGYGASPRCGSQRAARRRGRGSAPAASAARPETIGKGVSVPWGRSRRLRRGRACLERAGRYWASHAPSYPAQCCSNPLTQ